MAVRRRYKDAGIDHDMAGPRGSLMSTGRALTVVLDMTGPGLTPEQKEAVGIVRALVAGTYAGQVARVKGKR
jgi:hypothetical protein